MSSIPIKRSKALMPLSREHHFYLLLAWKIRKGIGTGIGKDRIVAYIRYMNEKLVRAHFEDEEKWLFESLLPEDSLCGRAMKEHESINRMLQQVMDEEKNTRDELLLQLADAVEKHVRFEERELFPHLERVFTKAKMAELEEKIFEKHGNFTETWNDSFWET